MKFKIGDRVIYKRSPHSSEVGYICSTNTKKYIPQESYQRYDFDTQIEYLLDVIIRKQTYGVMFFTADLDNHGRPSIYSIDDIDSSQLELCNNESMSENVADVKLSVSQFPIGIRDVNGKMIHINDVLQFNGSEIVKILDDGTGPTQQYTEILVVSTIDDEIIFNTVQSFIDIQNQNFISIGYANIKFAKKSFSEQCIGYHGVLTSYDPEQFEIIGHYNPIQNEITLLNPQFIKL